MHQTFISVTNRASVISRYIKHPFFRIYERL